MIYTTLGRTGLSVSRLALGAGPIPATMIHEDDSAQTELIRTALDAGINWIDTAAGYGDGRSESSIGAALESLGRASEVYVATKVRLTETDLNDVESSIRASLEASLKRLRLDHVTLLQLHNSVTAERGDEPTSITPRDVLGPGGVLAAFETLRKSGLVRHFGFTGIGQPESLRTVVRSGAFDTIQIPYNILNRSAGQPMPLGFFEVNYGNVIEDCALANMGVFAIRVYAGGALLGNPPSAHTLKTKFFPLDLYQRDCEQSRRLKELLPSGLGLKEAAVRFALSHPAVTSAIVGFSEPAHISEALQYLTAGPLPENVRDVTNRHIHGAD